MGKLQSKIRIGLQAKAVVILAFLVLSATFIGGWTYLGIVSKWIQNSNLQQAERLAEGISLAATSLLAEGDEAGVEQLAESLLSQRNILYVAFLDQRGRTVATAGETRGSLAQPLIPAWIDETYVREAAGHCLIVARPIETVDGSERLGALRLTLDSSAAAGQVSRAYDTMLLLACLIVVGAIPVGYLLVWRAVSLPIRRLMKVTTQLAQGDFTARASTTCNDEIGCLAESFNTMAEQIDGQRRQLLAAKEQLEQKVLQRTSELNSVNERLRAEMSEKEDFLRAVSHDLNAPLRNIAGMATMVMMKHRDSLPEDVIARLQRIQANVDTETELINELLELSRIKSRPQKRERTDMNEIFSQLRSSFEFDLRSRNIQLRIAPSMPVLYVEKSRFRQIFQNLIDNAIKYMGDRTDGRIDAGYELRGQEHVFFVRDNGQGISQEDQEKVFHVFRRASTASVSKVPGKGVGLASVKSIVGNYDGRVWVESELGTGSTFCIALNRSRTDEEPEGETDDHDHIAADKIDDRHFHPVGG